MKYGKLLLPVGNDEKGFHYIFNGRKYRLKRTELHRNENSSLLDLVHIYEPDKDIVEGEDEDAKSSN